VRGGRVVERFESLVNPQRPIPPMITALTNISWAMVKDAPTFRDICDQVLATLGGRIFVAHNADFDWRFVSAEVQRATGRRLDGERLCTVRLARRLLPQLRSRRLDSVVNHYGIEIEARHRAGGDAEATARVLLRLLADARGRDCDSWEELPGLLAARTARRSRGRRPPAMPRPIDKDTTA
ncbi:MAG TPA: 3'-5' exonuclease, partial [Gemmatimonadaceae bacterium]|nr:3'-5' exonuclease [Gemmatimonadaceae bacterium]